MEFTRRIHDLGKPPIPRAEGHNDYKYAEQLDKKGKPLFLELEKMVRERIWSASAGVLPTITV